MQRGIDIDCMTKGQLEPEVQYDGFFFSSRRRHTRLQGDWSSDVCSSDLPPPVCAPGTGESPAAFVTGDVATVTLSRAELEIGRASCRERGKISEDALAVQQKTTDRQKPEPTDVKAAHRAQQHDSRDVYKR